MRTSQAIQVRRMALTASNMDHRWRATAVAGSLIFDAADNLTDPENAYHAALALARKLNWTDATGAVLPHAFGTLPDGSYALCFAHRE